jgi:hypothetical protein
MCDRMQMYNIFMSDVNNLRSFYEQGVGKNVGGSGRGPLLRYFPAILLLQLSGDGYLRTDGFEPACFLVASQTQCYSDSTAYFLICKQSWQLWILRVTPLAQTRLRCARNYCAISLAVRGSSCGTCLPLFFTSLSREILVAFLDLAVVKSMRSGFGCIH